MDTKMIDYTNEVFQQVNKTTGNLPGVFAGDGFVPVYCPKSARY